MDQTHTPPTADPAADYTPILTEADVDAGEARIACRTVDGRTREILTRAVPWRHQQRLASHFVRTADIEPILAQVLGGDAESVDRLLRGLDAESIDRLQCVALEWVLGAPKLGEIARARARLLAQRSSTVPPSPPSAGSSPGDGLPTSSPDGASSGSSSSSGS